MKESKKKAQRQQIYEVLKEFPQTTKMIQINIGIPRENITRHIAELEKRHQITIVERKKCKITSHIAKYYSSEQKYFPKETQAELFSTPKPKHRAGILR